MTTLYDDLADGARRHPRREALVYRDARFTYGELLARVDVCAAGLHVDPGTRVAIVLNGVDYVVALFAAAKAGAIACPIDVRLPPAVTDAILTDIAPDLILTEHNFRGVCEGRSAPLTDAPVDVDPHAAAAIFYTAGTSSEPVGVVHSHASLRRAGPALAHKIKRDLMPSPRALKLYARHGRRLARAARKPTALLPLALQNISGHTALCDMFAAGGRFIATDGFHPHRTLELVEREHVTNIGGTPMMLELLLHVKKDFDLSSLLLVVSGGELASPRLLQRCEERFGCLVAVGYGATELGGAVMLTTIGRRGVELDTVGTPLRDVEMRIDGGEEGELHVRVPTPMLGYWNRPELTSQQLDADGWFRTGDLARREPDGTIKILGRLSDVIDQGGTSMPAPRLERALETVEGVDAIAVVATTDAQMVAFVESSDGCDERALRARAHATLPTGMQLDRIVTMPHLPRTPDGKVRKEELRELASGGAR